MRARAGDLARPARGRRAPCRARRSSPAIRSCRAASGSSSTRAAARSVGRPRRRSRSGTSGPRRPSRRCSRTAPRRAPSCRRPRSCGSTIACASIISASGRSGRPRRRGSDVVAGTATAWTRLDGDPATPERDPMLRAPDWALSIGRFTARADKTPAGRVRHDLVLHGRDVPTAAQPSISTCGFASSFTGDRFEIAGAADPAAQERDARAGRDAVPRRRAALVHRDARARATPSPRRIARRS